MKPIVLIISSLLFIHDSQASAAPFRADCRYHNIENIPGVSFCYGSALYDVAAGTGAISNIRMGVGCDYQTIFNDGARSEPQEAVSDRFSPMTSSTPAIEVRPKGSFSVQGTYPSVLDTSHGRMEGTCYVQMLAPDGRRRLEPWDY